MNRNCSFGGWPLYWISVTVKSHTSSTCNRFRWNTLFLKYSLRNVKKVALQVRCVYICNRFVGGVCLARSHIPWVLHELHRASVAVFWRPVDVLKLPECFYSKFRDGVLRTSEISTRIRFILRSYCNRGIYSGQAYKKKSRHLNSTCAIRRNGSTKVAFVLEISV